MPSRQVNIHEAKTHLSKLLRRVQKGEEITIANAGKPVAKLVRVDRARRRPKPGYGKGTIKFHGDFTAPMREDWLDEFHNGPIIPEPRKT